MTLEAELRERVRECRAKFRAATTPNGRQWWIRSALSARYFLRRERQ